jgi:hypothetical protein
MFIDETAVVGLIEDLDRITRSGVLLRLTTVDATGCALALGVMMVVMVVAPEKGRTSRDASASGPATPPMGTPLLT